MVEEYSVESIKGDDGVIGHFYSDRTFLLEPISQNFFNRQSIEGLLPILNIHENLLGKESLYHKAKTTLR